MHAPTMKHLLTAALIATTLASPVSAETYTVNCSNEDVSNNVTLVIDTTNQALSFAEQEGVSFRLTTTIWNDDYIGFQITRSINPVVNIHASALLNRNNGLMGATSVKFDEYSQLTFENLQFHCTRRK